VSTETTVAAPKASQIADEVLRHARKVVQPELEAALRRLSPDLHVALEGHLAAGGKFVRAGLVLLSATACGGDEHAGLDGAVAIELVHNFSLIHDDVIDGDLERRHRPTLWSEYGINHAIISGDALATVAFQVLLEVPTPERAGAASLLADATQAMIAGQAQDMALEQRATATLDECIEMVSGKTAALLRCAACLGAVLCGAPDSTISALWEFGHHLGMAFQAVDDVLGIWGEQAVTGKPVGSDLRRRKKTLPVCIALSHGVDLGTAIGDPSHVDVSDEEVEAITSRLDACGARKATMDLGERHMADALAALDRVPLTGQAKEQLTAVANFVVDRDR
jgi:geranylgeranyl diphosphate synthase type I